MHIKTIIAGAAIVLAATIGMVSADDQFSALEGVTAVAMSSGELEAVTGMREHFLIIHPISGEVRRGPHWGCHGPGCTADFFFESSWDGAGFGCKIPNGHSFCGGHQQNAEDRSGVVDICGYTGIAGGC